MGIFYRVEQWSGANPGEGYPVVPDASKIGLWRRHNLFRDDIIETTEVLLTADKPITEWQGQPIPENGIGNWTVGANRGTERDERAFDTSYQTAAYWKSLADMGNHCQGHDYRTIHDVLKEARKKLGKNAKADRLLAKAALKPLGLVIASDAEALTDLYYLSPREPKLPRDLSERAEKLLSPGAPVREG